MVLALTARSRRVERDFSAESEQQAITSTYTKSLSSPRRYLGCMETYESPAPRSRQHLWRNRTCSRCICDRPRRCAPEMLPRFVLCFPGQLEAELRAEGSDVTVLGPVRLRNREVSPSGPCPSIGPSGRKSTRCSCSSWSVDPVRPSAGCRAGASSAKALFLHNPPVMHWLDLFVFPKNQTSARNHK